MSDLAFLETILTNASVRRVVENGTEYFVAPISLIVPGVLAGSKGALYYPLEETRRNPGIWNNVPIVVYHPTDPVTNLPLSAKDKSVIDRSGIGVLRNDRWENGKRIADGWIDAERVRRIDPRVYNVLSRNGKMETSTGLFTKNLPALLNSHFNGKPYHAIATNYMPDHLAILPDQVGACSLNDGCGLNVNSSSIDTKFIDNLIINDDKIAKVAEWLSKNGLMPGYGQVFVNDENENVVDEIWYVGGDGDEDGFSKLVESKFKEIGAKKVIYEAEGFPPKDQSWVQLWPKRKAWTTVTNVDKLIDQLVSDITGNFNPKGCNQHSGPGCGGNTSKSNIPKTPEGIYEKAGEFTKDEYEEAKKVISGLSKADTSSALTKLGFVFGASESSKKLKDRLGQLIDERRSSLIRVKALDPEHKTGSVKRGLASNREEVDAIINQGRHLESGQFLNKTGISIKQLISAASKGFADLDGEQHTEEIESMSNENDIDTLLENVNPEGCNQHTGPGCGGGGNVGKTPKLKGVSDKDPKTMSAASINKELDILSEHSSKNTDKFIEAGRGHERPSDYLTKTDEISVEAKYIFDRRHALKSEVERRAGPGMRRLPKGFGPLRNQNFPQYLVNLLGESMTLTEQQKETAVTYLTTNCECWKGKENVLNEMDDNVIIDILKDVRNRENDTIIANSVKSGIKIGNEIIKYDSEKKTLVKNACGSGKMDHPEIADEEEEVPETVVPAKKKAPPVVKNEEVTNQQMTTEQFDKLCINHFGHPAATVKAGLDITMKALQAKKEHLVKRLVANVSSDERKKELATNLLTKPVGELETMVELLPPTQHINNRITQEPNLNFLGIGGGPAHIGIVDNASDDILETPTINWSEMEGVSPAFRNGKK